MKTEFWIIDIWRFQYIIWNPQFDKKYICAGGYICMPICSGKEKECRIGIGGAFNYSEMTKLERV